MPAMVNDAGPGLGGYSVLSPTASAAATPTPPVNPNQQDTGTSRASGASFTPGPIPNIDIYARAEVMANNAYDKAVAQLNQNRLNTLTNYGYTGNVDPTTGVLSGVRVDPNAIHGQLQDLLHNQALEDQQATFAAQDRGLLGGLAHQAGSEMRFQHGSQDTALGTNLTQALADYQSQQQDAAQAKNDALWQAEQTAANAATANQEGESIDQLIASLGNPKDVKPADQTPVTGGSGNADTGSGGGGSKPGKGGGGRGGRGGHTGGGHRTRSIRRVLRGGGGGGRSARAL